MESSSDKNENEQNEILNKPVYNTNLDPLKTKVIKAELEQKEEALLITKNLSAKALACEEGYNALINELKNASGDGFYKDEDNITPIPIESFEISSDTMRELKNFFITGKQDPSKVNLKFSSETLIIFYNTAIKLYNDQCIEAIKIFHFLTELYPSVQSFWVGLGLCYEKNQEFPAAIHCFEKAIRVDKSNLRPYYSLIRCSQNIKDFSVLDSILTENLSNEKNNQELNEIQSYVTQIR